MRTITSSIALLALLALLSAGAIAGERELSTRIFERDGWVAYNVAMTADAGAPCCFADLHDHAQHVVSCELESRSWSMSRSDDDRRVSAASKLTVYLRVHQGKIDKVRAFAADCPIKDGDRATRIDPVDATDSVALLARDAASTTGRDVAEAEIAALAMHADASATTALTQMAEASHPRKLREQALFWLGQMRGAEGARIVERAATSDGDAELRANAVFDLSQAHGIDAYASIHRIARNDASEHVREQAMFWMAQMGDARAKADITAAIGSDASDKVREQGVFALSQLKQGEGDSALIALVRGDYPRRVKEQALFWLGQSGSDAAMKFLDEVLTRTERSAGKG